MSGNNRLGTDHSINILFAQTPDTYVFEWSVI